MNIKDPTHLLRSCRMFTELSARDMDQVRALTTCKTAHKGEIIFREGQLSLGFYVLASGLVKVYRIAPSGREQIMHFVEAGDTFAEATIFSGAYPANAEALSDCVLLRVDREGFKKLLGQNPQFSFKIIATLEKWLKRMSERISELSVGEVPARFACYVLSLFPPTVLPVKGNTECSMKISKTALAQMLGTTKETLSRIIHRLQERRILIYRGRKIVVLNKSRLEEIAAGELKLT